MACCTISNCGDNVTINTCCGDSGSVNPSDYNDIFGAGTGIDGSWSDNAKLSEQGNLLVDYICQPNGDLLVKWATKTPTDTTLSIDGTTVTPSGTNTHTITAYGATSLIVISITGTSEFVTVLPVACQVLGEYTFTSACDVNPLGDNQILLSWTTSEFIYIYREADNKLIVQTDTINQYADNAPLFGTNTYILSSTPISEGLTELARVSHDFNTCLTPCANPVEGVATGGTQVTYEDRATLIDGVTTDLTLDDIDDSIYYAIVSPSPSDNGDAVRYYIGGLRANDGLITYTINSVTRESGTGIKVNITFTEPGLDINNSQPANYPKYITCVMDYCDN